MTKLLLVRFNFHPVELNWRFNIRSFILAMTASCFHLVVRFQCSIIAELNQSRREKRKGKRSTIEHTMERQKFTPNGRHLIGSKCSTAAKSSKNGDFSADRNVTRFGVTWPILAKEFCANAAKKSGMEFDHTEKT